MVELLCSRHPQAGYERRNLYTHRSRLTGVSNVKKYENFVTFVYLFIILQFPALVNPQSNVPLSHQFAFVDV
jgi:hypothetical protein